MRIGLSEILVTLFLLFTAVYLLIVFLPFLAVIVIILAVASGLFYLVRRAGRWFQAPHGPRQQFDERGHRVTRATVMDMSETDSADKEPSGREGPR